MRLGDLDALKDDFDCVGFNDYDDYNRALRIIDNAPTVEPEKAKESELIKAYTKGFDTGVETVKNERPQGEWVPVSERLPEKTGYYLVTRKGFSIKNHVKRVGYDANTKRWSEGSIIAWQPLPEPYKEGGEE